MRVAMLNARAQMFEASERRRAYVVRTLSFLGAGTVIVLAFWSAGAPPSSWFKWFVHSREQTQSVPAATNTPKVVPQPLHGPQGIAPPTPKGNDSSISKTPLALILTGTMPGRNSREGFAMLGVDKDSPQTYSAGALLANGARIAEIYPQYVVLEKEGRSAQLFLQGTKGKSDSKRVADLLTVGGPQDIKPAVATHQEILTDYIRPSPVYDGEMLKGYEVYAGQHAGVFSQMGLQPGDVITSINGVPLNDAATSIELFHQITEGSAATATVERKGHMQTLSLDGSLITADQERIKNPPAPMTMPGGLP